MQIQNFGFLQWLVFLAIFVCLPLPHGNVYPFIPLVLTCLYNIKKYQIKLTNINAGLAVFFGFGLLSTFWAIDPTLTLKLYAKVISIVLSGYLWISVYQQLSEEQQYSIRNITFIASVSLLMGLLFFIVDLKRGGRLFTFIAPHISPAFVHAAIACSLTIWANLNKLHKLLQLCVLISAIVILNFATSDAASLGVILGGSVLLLHKILPRFVRFMFIYGMPTVWFLMPFIFLRILTPENYHQWADSIDTSYTHRLFIWHASAEQIFERFWMGFGFGSSRFKEFGLKAEEVIITASNTQQVFESPVHPHNYMLQIWLELGLLGVIIACAAWILYWKKHYYHTDVYTIAFWGSAMCVSATSISVWQSWWLILIVTLLPIYTWHTTKIH